MTTEVIAVRAPGPDKLTITSPWMRYGKTQGGPCTLIRRRTNTAPTITRWRTASGSLRSQPFILAASNAGYDTLIKGIRDAEALRFELRIPKNEQIMSVIALGKKAKEPVQRQRKKLEEVTQFFRDHNSSQNGM